MDMDIYLNAGDPAGLEKGPFFYAAKYSSRDFPNLAMMSAA